MIVLFLLETVLQRIVGVLPAHKFDEEQSPQKSFVFLSSQRLTRLQDGEFGITKRIPGSRMGLQCNDTVNYPTMNAKIAIRKRVLDVSGRPLDSTVDRQIPDLSQYLHKHRIS